jgi:sugar phosphate isomerase/epimerase
MRLQQAMLPYSLLCFTYLYAIRRENILMRLLCSTGAFSRFPDLTDYRAVLRYGPLLAVDGFEVMFYPSWTGEIEQIAHRLQQSGLRFPAIHAEKGIAPALISDQPEEREQGWRWFEASCYLGQALGSQVLVFHLWGLPQSDTQIERNFALLSDCISLTERNNMLFAIETIPCQLATPLSHVRAAIERDNRSRVALDTEFLAMHAQLAEAFQADWLWNEKRVVHIHIKDYDGQLYLPDSRRRYLQPGEGTIDFAQCFAALHQHHYNGYVSLEAPVALPDGTRNITRLNESLHLLRDWMDNIGNKSHPQGDGSTI